MRSVYFNRLSETRLAVVDVHEITFEEFRESCEEGMGHLEGEKFFMISRVNVPREFRCQGHGTSLLEKVTEEADFEEVNLVLEISPYEDGPDYDVLFHWYSSFGFRELNDSSFFWRPHNPVEVEV